MSLLQTNQGPIMKTAKPGILINIKQTVTPFISNYGLNLNSTLICDKTEHKGDENNAR